MKLSLLFISLITIILVSSCTNNITSKATKEIPREDGEISVYFCPEDDCEGILFGLLENAKWSIHCALFDLKLESIISILENKSKEIDVKVVTDEINDKGNLKGEWIRMDDGKQYSHNKFCIVDKIVLFTGSFNPTERDAYKNDNNFIVINSRYLSENYEEEFNELWSGRFGEGETVKYPLVMFNNFEIENYFCPEDNCAAHIVKTINRAKKGIYFMVFSFTLEEVADAILFTDVEDIKGVFEKLQAGSEYSQFKRLKGFGLDVKTDSNKYNMHHKVFILDNETVITGSMNPTGSGNWKNDENILIIKNREIAEKYLENFNRIWNMSSS